MKASTFEAIIINNLKCVVACYLGHSLGAHTCAAAGQRYTEITGSLVAQISGLDPISK